MCFHACLIFSHRWSVSIPDTGIMPQSGDHTRSETTTQQRGKARGAIISTLGLESTRSNRFPPRSKRKAKCRQSHKIDRKFDPYRNHGVPSRNLPCRRGGINEIACRCRSFDEWYVFWAVLLAALLSAHHTLLRIYFLQISSLAFAFSLITSFFSLNSLSALRALFPWNLQ